MEEASTNLTLLALGTAFSDGGKIVSVTTASSVGKRTALIFLGIESKSLRNKFALKLNCTQPGRLPGTLRHQYRACRHWRSREQEEE